MFSCRCSGNGNFFALIMEEKIFSMYVPIVQLSLSVRIGFQVIAKDPGFVIIGYCSRCSYV